MVEDPFCTCSKRLISMTPLFVLAGILTFQNIKNVHQLLPKFQNDFDFAAEPWISERLVEARKMQIGYAITVTDCKLGGASLDGAAVLKHSIHLASHTSKYDYRLHAFVHPDAQACASLLSHLGYDVQILPSPVNVSDIRNVQLQKATKSGCCGIKEMMKLYSYLLTHVAIVVHLDVDTIMLKPLDDLFDLMLDSEFNRSKIPAMWLSPDQFPFQIDFLFTRDYNMVDPPRRQPHQVGVQGGFLVLRPNETDFRRLVEIVLDGANFEIRHGWGGPELKYGGYYGAATVQGLSSYYFGHIEKGRALELNRCYYNSMVDDPMNTVMVKTRNDPITCRTLQETCQDCRDTDMADIHTAHFTICGKPWWCGSHGNQPEEKHLRLCWELHREWHKIRFSLEQLWIEQYQDYKPTYAAVNNTASFKRSVVFVNNSFGHCRVMRSEGYIRLQYPTAFNQDSKTE